MTPDLLLENDPDVFEVNGGSATRLPVYTIDRATVERAKGDAPPWIVVTRTADLNDPVNKRLHEAVINNFNFEYLYDHFFDPAKVAPASRTRLDATDPHPFSVWAADGQPAGLWTRSDTWAKLLLTSDR